MLSQPSTGTNDPPFLDTPDHRLYVPTVSPDEVQGFHFSLTQTPFFFLSFSHTVVLSKQEQLGFKLQL